MSASYRPTIGLEIHAELKTQTKMFCDSPNDTEAAPNTNVCPVCMAHPGTLPAVNKEAVRHVLRVGAAIGGTLADYAEFDRKSYFYPDIPKGYQISQYEHPLVEGGELHNVKITRVHLEEDTASSSHEGGASLVDFNRAGVPLMELVTEPVIHDAKTAGDFARELRLVLRTLGASDANLEKGEMRIEANISVSKDDTFGTKVEVKNLNSFRSVERAIEFEIARQVKLLEEGGKVDQETRGWDEDKQQTFHQRFKEGSADYRYFPEPDIPKLLLSEMPEFSEDAITASLPELPWERRARYANLGLKSSDAEYLSASRAWSAFFDAVIALLEFDAALVPLAANYSTSDIAGFFAKRGMKLFEKLHPEHLAHVMRMVKANELSSRGAKEVLAIIAEEGGDAKEVASLRGLIQMSDVEALRTLVKEVIAAEEAAVGEYRGGKEASLQYLIGKSMKASKGAGNPGILKELLIEELGK
jgi:aspartyl-tRNA(Asn)/glutamyl-tRNA(Gln) amidotransferase subunit B